MTTESTDLDTDARQWAIETLDFCDPNEAIDTGRMLRFIDESDYVLPIDQADAIQIIADSTRRVIGPSTVERAAVRCRYQLQRDAVAQFNRQFFDFPCEERLRRWKSVISESSQFPDIVAKMMRLKPGLNVALPAIGTNSRSNYVVQRCRDIFLESPAAAARLRLQFCDEWRNDVSNWEEVVDDALDRHCEFIQTISPWVDEFGDRRFWEEQKRLECEMIRRRDPERIWSEFTPPKNAAASALELEHLMSHSNVTHERVDSHDSEEQPPTWIWIAVAAAIVLVLTALSQPSLTVHDRHPSPTHRSTPFSIPHVPPSRLR